MQTLAPHRTDTGDTLFTRGQGLFSRLTVALTGPAAHQAIYYDPEHIVEASKRSGKIVQRKATSVFSELEKTGSEWIVFHWVNPPVINPFLRAMIQCDLKEAMEFDRYSTIELPLQAMDVLWNRLIRKQPLQGYDAAVFRKLGDIWQNGVICSKTGNRPLIKARMIPTESGLEYASPSDTYRYFRASRDVVILAHSKGWFKAHGA